MESVKVFTSLFEKKKIHIQTPHKCAIFQIKVQSRVTHFPIMNYEHLCMYACMLPVVVKQLLIRTQIFHIDTFITLPPEVFL